MKTRHFIIILFSLLLASCGRENDIKIGFSAGMSGKKSQLGVSARKSVRLAVDEVNEKGGIKGRKIRLITRDDRSDPETGFRVDRELPLIGSGEG